MQAYDLVYEGPPLGPSSVRVLRLNPVTSLDPSALEEPIVCTAEIVHLDDNPEFTALSYCWGTGGFDRTMTCNGVSMNITSTLDRALRWFRQTVADSHRNTGNVSKIASLVIWADAVCINQNNTSERNAQVKLMGSIYSHAKRVFISLGEATQYTLSGLQLAGQIWNDALAFGKENPQPNTRELLRKMPLPSRHHPGWRGLIDLLTRPWFSRCWVIQEFSMCGDRIFACGEHTFTWLLLDTVVRLIDTNVEASMVITDTMTSMGIQDNLRFWDANRLTSLMILRALGGTVATDQWFEAMRGSKEPVAKHPIWDMFIALGQTFQATDARDKIYALMGMAADLEELPHPDYDLSVD